MKPPHGKNENLVLQRVHNTNGTRKEFIQTAISGSQVNSINGVAPVAANNKDDGYDVGSEYLEYGGEGSWNAYQLVEFDGDDAVWLQTGAGLATV
jgi:hypothetical protein